MRDRTEVKDSDCPNSGGPFLTDDMMDFACNLVKIILTTAREKDTIKIGLCSEDKCDIHAKALGGLTYIFAMRTYIHELEDELRSLGKLPSKD